MVLQFRPLSERQPAGDAAANRSDAPQETQNKRFELKLTGTVAPGHTIAGGFLTNSTNLTNNSGLFSYVIDPHSLVNYSEPNNYFYTNYKGVLGASLLVEAQYSQRHFRFDGDGGTSTVITDSPFFSATQCACLYNAPYFDATDGENRNNKQLTGSVTKFWTRGGRHETKGGYEWFRSQRTGGNSQSSTLYVFSSDFVTNADGTPQLDSTGRPIPMFVPGTSYLDYYPAVRGAVLNVDNNSLYVQDHWTINGRLSADLGARYEHVKALSTGDIQSVDVGRIVPRLGVAYALDDNGDKIVHFNYGQYQGATTRRRLRQTARSATRRTSSRFIGDRRARVTGSRQGSILRATRSTRRMPRSRIRRRTSRWTRT